MVIVVGIGLTLYSLTLPYYTDPAMKEKLESEANQQILANSADYHKIKKDYYTKVKSLTTNKNIYFDLGSGIATAALCLIAFVFAFKINSASDLANIKSLNKPLLFTLAIALWLLLIPGTFWYYSLRGERGDYPMFADSIAIPIMENVVTIVIGSLFLVTFLFITTYKSTFPTLLFIKPITYNGYFKLKEVLWGFLLLFNVFALILFVTSGDHVSIVVNIFYTYLIIALRAGQVNYYNENQLAFQAA
jgi:hypothetical protein